MLCVLPAHSPCMHNMQQGSDQQSEHLSLCLSQRCLLRRFLLQKHHFVYCLDTPQTHRPRLCTDTHRHTVIYMERAIISVPSHSPTHRDEPQTHTETKQHRCHCCQLKSLRIWLFSKSPNFKELRKIKLFVWQIVPTHGELCNPSI